MVRTLVARVCFAFALLTAVAHLSTYLGFDPMTPFPALWMMHVAAMAALASTLLSGNVRLLPRGSSVLDLLDAAFHRRGERRGGQCVCRRKRVCSCRPSQSTQAHRGSVGRVCACQLLRLPEYLARRSTGPARRPMVLESHGKVVASLSEAAYRRDRAVQTRLATGHWLFAFYLSGALWSVARTGRAR